MTTDCRLVRCCIVGMLEYLGVLRLSVVSRQPFAQAAWHPELEQTILVVLTLGSWMLCSACTLLGALAALHAHVFLEGQLPCKLFGCLASPHSVAWPCFAFSVFPIAVRSVVARFFCCAGL